MLFLWVFKDCDLLSILCDSLRGGWILLFDVFKYFLLIHERIPSFSLVLLFILSQFSPDYKITFFISPIPSIYHPISHDGGIIHRIVSLSYLITGVFLPLCRLFHLHISLRFPHDPSFHHDPSPKKMIIPAVGVVPPLCHLFFP